MIKSLDPRITREQIELNNPINPLADMDQWETYEVFHQKKRGDQHEHVGIVHAPNLEMALLFSKEQFGRRGISVNIWVVKTSNVFASDYDDADIFETVPDKQYREAGGYKVMEMINKYKKENKKII
ncbi:MAG: 1,2-phenylacetyl-CoA epoxidase subunit B [Bacteroidetes bacterium]|nr:1,2-phenylacetyl-CoA epoxidase subunit B [Bacteroidota bacterium]